MSMSPLQGVEAVRRGRDLRLDFFRGLALWFIFLDHIPSNFLSSLTIQNVGFSDAAEIFVFISGYAAAVAYGSIMRRRGFAFAAAGVWRRVWQLYIAQIVLFMVFTAQIAYVVAHFQNPMYADEMRIVDYFRDPYRSLAEALLLKFKPADMDILPLYIVLLAGFPFALYWLPRRPRIVLAASAAFWAVVHAFHLNLPGYPPGTTWHFNPLAWQLLFVTGAVCAAAGPDLAKWLPSRRVLLPVAVAYLAFAAFVVATWTVPFLDRAMPNWLGKILYPIDKGNLDILRYAHFLALAYVTVTLVGRHSAFLSGRAARPLIVCGQHSLQVFCVGTFLSFAGHWILVQINGGNLMQIAVSVAGIGLMCGLAYGLAWYKRAEAGARQGSEAARRPATE